ncbi:pyridoxal-phosphate dependent enzyme [Candidatus Bathyarchaeota archaeon]|nr:pyridoxal-phosphate dependent enzyme [Candidatus Bathyarchaeota archaeon]
MTQFLQLKKIKLRLQIKTVLELSSRKESKGLAETVSDEEIIEAQRLLVYYEGLFVEPASAASIAGLQKLISSGKIDENDTVICITTGHGLKDPEIVMQKYPTYPGKS